MFPLPPPTSTSEGTGRSGQHGGTQATQEADSGSKAEPWDRGLSEVEDAGKAPGKGGRNRGRGGVGFPREVAGCGLSRCEGPEEGRCWRRRRLRRRCWGSGGRREERPPAQGGGGGGGGGGGVAGLGLCWEVRVLRAQTPTLPGLLPSLLHAILSP